MQSQGLWDSVTVVTLSDFGRTLTSNGLGTDHGWGGNMFLFGGAVRGGQVLGTYPDELGDSSPVNLGRAVQRRRSPVPGPWARATHHELGGYLVGVAGVDGRRHERHENCAAQPRKLWCKPAL